MLLSPSSLNNSELVPIVLAVANIVPASLQLPDVHTEEDRRQVVRSQALLARYDRCVAFLLLMPSIIDLNVLPLY